MSIVKEALQTIIHIAVNAEGAISHAWKVTHFVVKEDDKEISRGASGQENVEPADLANVLPAHADVVAQLAQKDAAHLELKGAAEQALADMKAAAEAALADANAKIADLQSQLNSVRAAHDAWVQRAEAAKAALSS